MSRLAVALPYLVCAMFIRTYMEHGTLRPGLMGADIAEIGSVAARLMWFTCLPIPLLVWRMLHRRSAAAAVALALSAGMALWAQSRAGIIWTVAAGKIWAVTAGITWAVTAGCGGAAP